MCLKYSSLLLFPLTVFLWSGFLSFNDTAPVLKIESKTNKMESTKNTKTSNFKTVAVVELFTSQGCSSCPAADALLSTYKDDDQVIALAYHVDYWDRLGWKDTFSKPLFSAYQREYNTRLQSGTYTPQMVVNGKVEFVGSNKVKLHNAIDNNISVSLLPSTVVKRESNMIKGSYTFTELKNTNAYALLVLESHTVQIKKGENASRSINYTNVVLEKQKLDPKKEGNYVFTIPENYTKNHKLKVIFLTQDQNYRIQSIGVTKV